MLGIQFDWALGRLCLEWQSSSWLNRLTPTNTKPYLIHWDQKGVFNKEMKKQWLDYVSLNIIRLSSCNPPLSTCAPFSLSTFMSLHCCKIIIIWPRRRMQLCMTDYIHKQNTTATVNRFWICKICPENYVFLYNLIVFFREQSPP